MALKIEYKILNDYHADKLEKQVVALTEEGYTPQGGVSVAIIGTKLRESYLKGNGMVQESAAFFTQAMIRVTEGEK